jgi:hypothetical protein
MALASNALTGYDGKRRLRAIKMAQKTVILPENATPRAAMAAIENYDKSQ